MPHAAVVAGAVVAGIATAVAFEMTLFRPWREQHGDDFLRDVHSHMSNFRQSFEHEFKSRMERVVRPQRAVMARGADWEQERTLREIEEFELARREEEGMRRRYESEMNTSQGQQEGHSTGLQRKEQQESMRSRRTNAATSHLHTQNSAIGLLKDDMESPHHRIETFEDEETIASMSSPRSHVTDFDFLSHQDEDAEELGRHTPVPSSLGDHSDQPLSSVSTVFEYIDANSAASDHDQSADQRIPMSPFSDAAQHLSPPPGAPVSPTLSNGSEVLLSPPSPLSPSWGTLDESRVDDFRLDQLSR